MSTRGEGLRRRWKRKCQHPVHCSLSRERAGGWPVAPQGVQSPGSDGGSRRVAELSEARHPHDLTAECQTSLFVKRKTGKSGRRESEIQKNITVVRDQMEWLSHGVTMSFCNCAVWLTSKWVTAERMLRHYSTGQHRAGEGDWFFILMGNWEGSLSDVQYRRLSETLLRGLCRMGECSQGTLGKEWMERHSMFISKHNKTVWLDQAFNKDFATIFIGILVPPHMRKGSKTHLWLKPYVIILFVLK